MRIFGFGYDSSVNEDMAIAPGAGDGKLYRSVQLAAISVMVIAVTLVILKACQLLDIGTTAMGIICSVGVLGICGFVALPWVRVFESFKDKRHKLTAIVFWALIGVCAVLWIICVWLIIGLIEKSKADTTDAIVKEISTSFNAIRISIIISMQFIISSYVAKNFIKYGKKLLPYQAMTAVSVVYIDFYLIVLLTSVSITAEGVEFGWSAGLLSNMWLHALLIIAALLGFFPAAVFRRIDRRNMLRARHDGVYETFGGGQTNNDAPAEPAQEKADAPAPTDLDTVDDKLNKIKELLDKGLITQEEYDRKREEIINSI